MLLAGVKKISSLRGGGEEQNRSEISLTQNKKKKVKAVEDA